MRFSAQLMGIADGALIDVLLGESNSRATRWAAEAAALPFDLRTGAAL